MSETSKQMNTAATP